MWKLFIALFTAITCFNSCDRTATVVPDLGDCKLELNGDQYYLSAYAQNSTTIALICQYTENELPRFELVFNDVPKEAGTFILSDWTPMSTNTPSVYLYTLIGGDIFGNGYFLLDPGISRFHIDSISDSMIIGRFAFDFILDTMWPNIDAEMPDTIRIRSGTYWAPLE